MTSYGDNVGAECRATGDPKPTVTWTFYGKVVQRNSRPLVITNFQSKDIGYYKCLAKNKYGDLVERQLLIGRMNLAC